MSSHTDEHSEHDAVEAHEGAHDHHDFDPEPVAEIADGEPRTPMWMPAVGLTLLVGLGLYVATGDDEPPSDGTAPTMTTWAAPGNAAEARGEAEEADSGAPQAPSKAQIDQVREKLMDFQAKQRGQGAGPRPAPAKRPTPPAGH